MNRVIGVIMLVALTGVGLRSPRAEDISISAVVEPSVIPVGAEATLVVTIKGKFRKSSHPQLPTLDEFSVYQAGSSQSFSIVNGQKSSSLQFNYVLVAQKEGRYTIEGIAFETGGHIYTARPVTIEVVKSASRLPPPAGASDDVQGETADSPIFISARVDRDTVYVNEQVTWTLGFYTDGRVDLLRTPEYSPPNSEGFWVEDLPPQRNYHKMIDGTKYLVNEIKRGLFPTAPGVHSIGAARVEIVVDDARRTGLDNFFDRRLRTFGFGKPKTLTTEEIPVTVLQLPTAGKPAKFSGLVGRNLAVSLKTDKQVVEAGDPVNVTLEIQGEGNFKAMAAPEIPDMAGFKRYESGSSSELFKNDYVVSGRKRTEFVLIPQAEGEVVIPPVQVSYFDPYEKRYKTIQSAPVQMKVKPGTKESGRQVVFTGSGENIEVLGHDIHYIHPVPAVISADGWRLLPGRAYFALHAVPLLAVVVALLAERRRKRWSGDIRIARARRAARDAERKLSRARAMEKSGRLDEVFSTISAAVRGYFADKMNRAAAGLTTEEIGDFLRGRGVAEDDLTTARAILKTCDGARYAPTSTSPEQARALLEQSLDAIRMFEKRYLG